MRCESEFEIIGPIEGEEAGSMVRILLSLVTFSLVSSWLDRSKIARLLLFFSHWMRYAMYM